jgi:hypothetical protein
VNEEVAVEVLCGSYEIGERGEGKDDWIVEWMLEGVRNGCGRTIEGESSGGSSFDTCGRRGGVGDDKEDLARELGLDSADSSRAPDSLPSSLIDTPDLEDPLACL